MRKVEDIEKPYCANFKLTNIEREHLTKSTGANLFRTHEFMIFEDHPEVSFCDTSIEMKPSFDTYQACKNCGYRPDKQYMLDGQGRFVESTNILEVT